MAEIVVGIDGSPGAATALGFAVAEARLHDAGVTALMAWGYLDQHHADGSDTFDRHYDVSQARQAADAALAAAGVDATGVEVRPDVANNLPADALLAAAASADLLVVGARGLGGFKGLLLGSVSDRCLSHTTRPVAVVPAASDGTAYQSRGRVVAGVDGSPGSRAALRWAIDEGRVRNAEVVAVHAWTTPYLGGEPLASANVSTDIYEASARRLLQEELDAVVADGEQRPESSLVFAGAATALLGAADDADLLVLGGPAPRGMERLVFGSTARQVIHHAPRPVVVVPPE